jgi:hypothetical protein
MTLDPRNLAYERELDRAAASPPPPAVKLGFFGRLAARAAGTTPSILLKTSPSYQIGNVVGTGIINIGSIGLNMGGYSLLVTNFYGDGHPSLPLCALGAATAFVVGAVDVCCLYRFQMHAHGLKELRDGGLIIPESRDTASVFATSFRIAQAFVTGSTVAFFASMHAYSADIEARIASEYSADNKAIISRVTPLYEAAIERATRSLNDQATLVRGTDGQIAVLQQSVVRASLRASRAPRSVSTVSNDGGATQLAALEAKRNTENQRLEVLKGELDRLLAERNRRIQEAVDSSPDRKPKRDGFTGRVRPFMDILRESPMRIMLVAAIEAIGFGIEIAPVLAHWIYVPSAYAAAMALDHLRRTTSLARQAATLFEGGDPSPRGPADGAPVPAPDDADPPVTEPRKKRGRPRKLPPNGHQPPLPS